jgi:hypothetical protein
MSVTNLVCKLGVLLPVKYGLHIPKLLAIRGLSDRIHIARTWDVPAEGDVFQRRDYFIRAYDEALGRMPIAR